MSRQSDLIARLTFRLRNRYFFGIDAVLLAVTPFVALFLRIDTEAFTGRLQVPLLAYTLLALVVKLATFYFFGLYRRYWHYASVDELLAIVAAVTLAMVVTTTVFLLAQHAAWAAGNGLPRSVPFIDGLLTLVVAGGSRFSVRAVASAQRSLNAPERLERKRVLLVGAGDAGEMIAREMRTSRHVNLEPVGFVDDAPSKQRMSIHGVPVLGTRQDLPRLLQEYDVQEVIIAMPTSPGSVIREVVRMCDVAHVPSRTVPGVYEILSGRVSVSQLRNVEIEDLLRREPVRIDAAEVARLLAGARVLVTGGGGSIGSELCRQIARCGPGLLTLLGHGENSLFRIENELRLKWPQLPLEVVVADIRDLPRLQQVFERTRPQIVFHAAAHKHVPLMETNCEEAVTNNVGGTRNLAQLAERFGVERFVLISSDKAVNSANVMGATKRIAELIVQQAACRTGRPYASVRFGNVLGSRGSVVVTFREQIARGGPVTVTHPDMRRYFMTIPEAVQLVLQAATLSVGGGEIFVLDMGEPVKIVDLARDLIELSGLETGRDIEIVFTGIRPGEKLSEELFVQGETYSRTRHDKIFLVRDALPPAHPDEQDDRLNASVDAIMTAAQQGQPDAVRRLIPTIVPTYQPAGCPPEAESKPALQAPS